MLKVSLREYVSAWGEVRIVAEGVDANGVKRIVDLVDRSRRGKLVVDPVDPSQRGKPGDREGKKRWIKVKA